VSIGNRPLRHDNRVAPADQPRDPVLDAQSGHALELALVVGHDDQIERDCLRGDQQVHRSDRHAAPFEFGAQIAVGTGGIIVVWDDLKRGEECLECRSVAQRAAFATPQRSSDVVMLDRAILATRWRRNSLRDAVRATVER
jgi:hypothetical protein